jgi:hypothetical protein
MRPRMSGGPGTRASRADVGHAITGATGRLLTQVARVPAHRYASEKTAGGFSDLWTRVMDAALADLSREISLSSDIKAALDKVGQKVALVMPGNPGS